MKVERVERRLSKIYKMCSIHVVRVERRLCKIFKMYNVHVVRVERRLSKIFKMYSVNVKRVKRCSIYHAMRVESKYIIYIVSIDLCCEGRKKKSTLHCFYWINVVRVERSKKTMKPHERTLMWLHLLDQSHAESKSKFNSKEATIQRNKSKYFVNRSFYSKWIIIQSFKSK